MLRLDDTKHYYVFRRGMKLKQSDVSNIFGTEKLLEFHPDLITKDSKSRIQGTDKLLAYTKDNKVTYKKDVLEKRSPQLFDQFMKGSKVNTDVPYKEDQIMWGIISGILKHDSRGYYFSKTARRRFLWI